MKNEWISRLLKPRPDPLLARVEELERGMVRMAREQAKTNVQLEASNRTQERMADDLGRALRRLEEALQKRYQLEAAMREEGIRQGHQAAVGEAVQGIMAVLDGLCSATVVARGAGADLAWLQGLEAVMKRGEEVLARWGIEPTSAPGMPFDPEVHEAVGIIENGPAGRTLIGEEVLRGYRIGKQVLRIAKVVVVRSEQDDRDRSGDHQLGGGGDWDGG